MPSVSWISPPAPGSVVRSAVEDVGRQHVPAHDGEVARRLLRLGLLHDRAEAVDPAVGLGDGGAAVPRDLVGAHPHQREHRRPVLVVRVDELAEHRVGPVREVVRQHAHERPVADGLRGAEHRVAETERLILAHPGEGRQVVAGTHRLELLQLATRLEQLLERGCTVKCCWMSSLPSLITTTISLGAGRDRLLDPPLDHGSVENREQLLGERLGGGKESRPQAGGGDDAMAEIHGGALSPVGHPPCSRTSASVAATTLAPP